MISVLDIKNKLKQFKKIQFPWLKAQGAITLPVQHVFREQNQKILLVSQHSKKKQVYACKTSDFETLPPKTGIGLLEPDEYQLFLLEPLPVSENEIASALQWRLKDLMNQPVSDVAIDYFFLPKRKSDEKSMLAAVAINKKKLQSKLDAWSPLGRLAVKKITIPEIGLAGLTSLYEKENQISSMIVCVQKNTLMVVLTAQQQIYFCRRVDLFLNDKTLKPAKDIALELVRLLDYFQQQWRQPAPGRYFVINETDSYLELLGEIQKILSLPLQGYAFDRRYVQAEGVPTQGYLNLGALFWEYKNL